MIVDGSIVCFWGVHFIIKFKFYLYEGMCTSTRLEYMTYTHDLHSCVCKFIMKIRDYTITNYTLHPPLKEKITERKKSLNTLLNPLFQSLSHCHFRYPPHPHWSTLLQNEFFRFLVNCCLY